MTRGQYCPFAKNDHWVQTALLSRKVMGFELLFSQGGAILSFSQRGARGQYSRFSKKGQRVQYCPFPKEGKGNIALSSRKGGGKILPFLDKVTRPKCKGVTRGHNCSFVKEGYGVQTALFPRKGKGAIMP